MAKRWFRRVRDHGLRRDNLAPKEERQLEQAAERRRLEVEAKLTQRPRWPRLRRTDA